MMTEFASVCRMFRTDLRSIFVKTTCKGFPASRARISIAPWAGNHTIINTEDCDV